MSRPSRATAAALTAALAVSLGACTSAPPEEPEEEDTLEGSIPEGNRYCRFIERATVEIGAAEQADEAREVLRKSDSDGWQCEVVVPIDGGPRTSEVFTLTVTINDEEAIEARRQEATEAGAEGGPDYLGESYLWPGHVVSIMPCRGPQGSAIAGGQVPYMFTMDASTEEGASEEAADGLVASLNYIIRDIDAGVGCSPSEAVRPTG